jgi:hypothetical protein
MAFHRVEVLKLPDYITFVGLLVIFFAAALGYGGTINRAFLQDRSSGWGYAAAQGVSVLALIGACLNAVGLAYGAAVDATFALGAALCLINVSAALISRRRGNAIVLAVRPALLDPVAWLATGVLVFSAVSIVPGTVLNPHDDLTQYLLRPMLMMHTGTLGTNWFDSTGLDGLGTQSWMQAFFVRHLPLNYADAFDDIVCLPLCCLLIDDIGRRLGATRLQSVLAAAVLVAINPVQVNTSAKYSIVLMILGLLFTLMVLLERFANRRSVLDCAGAIAAFVIFAVNAFAFKSTAFFFVLSICIVICVLLWLSLGRNYKIVQLITCVGGLFTLVLSIYMFTFIDLYRAAVTSSESALAVAGGGQATILVSFLRTIFDLGIGQYGQRPMNSTLGFATIGIIGAISFMRLRTLCPPAREFAPTFVITVSAGAAVLSFILSGISTPWGFLRYSTPVLTAILPVAILIGGRVVFPGNTEAGRRAGGPAIIISCALFLALNAPYIGERFELAWVHHTASLLGKTPLIIDETGESLSPERDRQIKAVQAHVPAGAAILAVTLMPADFDLRRNPISGMYLAGLESPWLKEMGDYGPQKISTYLKQMGIDYLIWQRAGAYLLSFDRVKSAREEALKNKIAMNIKSTSGFLAFYNAANALALGPVVYSDASYVVFQLDPSFKQTRIATSYDLGTAIDFTSASFNPFRGAGWSFPEPAGTWSDGKRAKLNLQLPQDTKSDVVLTTRLIPYVATGFPPPSVAVEVAGVEVARWPAIADSPAVRCAVIPAHLLSAGRLDLTLNIDAAPSPANLKTSGDVRELGVLVQSVVLDEASRQAVVCHE